MYLSLLISNRLCSSTSWMLLAMTFFFIMVVVFVFRPGSRKLHDDIAGIPLRNDDVPLSAKEEGR